MKLVLDAAPEIEDKYGIIVNKVSKKMLQTLKNENNKAIFLNKLFAGIQEHRRCDVSNITFLAHCEDLYEEDNVFVPHDDLKIIQGIPLKVIFLVKISIS